MAFCLSCDKEQRTGKFCLVCGRQLSSAKDQIDADTPIALKSGNANLAMWAHLAPLIAGIVALWVQVFFALLWLPGLLIRNSAKATDFERRHATESMNFQFTLLIVLTVGGVISFVAVMGTLGLALIVVGPLAIGVGITAMLVNVFGIKAALEGKEYKYPISIRFVK